MVAVLQHLLDTKLLSVVLPLGKTKLYQAVMTVLSKYGALEAESLQYILNIAAVCLFHVYLHRRYEGTNERTETKYYGSIEPNSRYIAPWPRMFKL